MSNGLPSSQPLQNVWQICVVVFAVCMGCAVRLAVEAPLSPQAPVAGLAADADFESLRLIVESHVAGIGSDGALAGTNNKPVFLPAVTR